MTRTISGTQPSVPRAIPPAESTPAHLYSTQTVEIVEVESAALTAALRRARIWNAVLGFALFVIATFAAGYWMGGGK